MSKGFILNPRDTWFKIQDIYDAHQLAKKHHSYSKYGFFRVKRKIHRFGVIVSDQYRYLFKKRNRFAVLIIFR